MTRAPNRPHQDTSDVDVLDPEPIEEAHALVRARPSSDGEVDIQVSTAKAYPRSIRKFRDKALAMATLDEATAESCIYALPRSGKSIEGPSARLAEIVASAWGNMRVEAKVASEDDRFVYAEATAWDLETNTAIRYSSRRRITDKYGKKYNDDMVAVTANAACSIALRNAVFKIVPKAYVNPIYEAAKQIAVGTAETLANKRAKMVGYFQKMGVTPEQIAAAVGKAGVDDITLEDLATLKGTATAIKDGDVSIDNAFPQVVKDMPGATGEKTSFGFGKGKGNPGNPPPARPTSANQQAAAPAKTAEDMPQEAPAD